MYITGFLCLQKDKIIFSRLKDIKLNFSFQKNIYKKTIHLSFPHFLILKFSSFSTTIPCNITLNPVSPCLLPLFSHRFSSRNYFLHFLLNHFGTSYKTVSSILTVVIYASIKLQLHVLFHVRTRLCSCVYIFVCWHVCGFTLISYIYS